MFLIDVFAFRFRSSPPPPFPDPYLNIDAGTMSPFEHGEVFVLDDGGEVRLQAEREKRESENDGMFLFFGSTDPPTQ